MTPFGDALIKSTASVAIGPRSAWQFRSGFEPASLLQPVSSQRLAEAIPVRDWAKRRYSERLTEPRFCQDV